jgi:hypothetical protein
MIRACVNRFSHIADSRYREFPTDTELFGPMTSLARLFHEVDVRVAKENNVTLVPYYDASVRYSGLQVSCVVRSFCIRQPVCVCVGGGGGYRTITHARTQLTRHSQPPRPIPTFTSRTLCVRARSVMAFTTASPTVCCTVATGSPSSQTSFCNRCSTQCVALDATFASVAREQFGCL